MSNIDVRTILLTGLVSFAADLLILSVFVPLSIGFRLVIILQIAFWTFFAASGATVTMYILKRFLVESTRIFIALSFLVFFLSLIPICVHAGILHDFPSALVPAAIGALITMHIVDSLTISMLVLAFKERALKNISSPSLQLTSFIMKGLQN